MDGGLKILIMKLKMNYKNHLKEWCDFFQQTLFFIPAIIYLFYKYNGNYLFVFFGFLAIQFMFTAYLHIVYYYKNKNEEFIIDSDKIIRIRNNKSETFFNKDIKVIIICKSATKDGWGAPFTTFETFRLARIFLKDGNHFIITNLLEYDLEIPLRILENVKFERRKGFSFFI